MQDMVVRQVVWYGSALPAHPYTQSSLLHAPSPSSKLTPPFPVLMFPSHHSLSLLPLKCLSRSPCLPRAGATASQVWLKCTGCPSNPTFIPLPLCIFKAFCLIISPVKDLMEFLAQALSPVALHEPQVPDLKCWLPALRISTAAALGHSHSRQRT